jgi:hypothetical protein
VCSNETFDRGERERHTQSHTRSLTYQMGATSAARCSGCQQRPASPWRAARSLDAAGRTCVSEGSRVSTTGGNSKSRGRIGSAQRRGSRSACSSLPQHCGGSSSAFSFGRTRRRNGGSRAARLCVADGGVSACRRIYRGAAERRTAEVRLSRGQNEAILPKLRWTRGHAAGDEIEGGGQKRCAERDSLSEVATATGSIQPLPQQHEMLAHC